MTDVRRAVEAVWRIEAARVVASAARVVGDIGLAEELAQDTLVTALERWPTTGVPRNPGAWLTTTVRNRAIDLLRRRADLNDKLALLGRRTPMATELELTPGGIEDDLLRLIFTACHPVLSAQSRVILTLRLLGGLSTREIARAYLSTESTVAQRISRAKRTLTERRVAFEVPEPRERAARLSSVLEVIYLIFNEGYSATAGQDWMRPALAEEALRLGRILVGLMPKEAEAYGLIALLELQASRMRARTDADGRPVLLLDQDRSRWDQLLIRRGLAALEQGERMWGDGPGPYALQAAIAACHARARTAEDTDWARIAELYALLVRLRPTAVVELNRAVAVSMAEGPAAALPLVDALVAAGSLSGYHLLPSVRGDLLLRLGRLAEARSEFERAASLTANEQERTLLRARASDCVTRSGES